MKESTFSPASGNLSNEEIKSLIQLGKSGDNAAREQLIHAYTPFIKKIVNKYLDYGVPYDDLLQEAYFGFLCALEKYDLTQDTKYSSFCSHYIEKYLKKATITQSSGRPIVYKEAFFYKMQKYLRAYDELLEQLLRTPSNSEIARKLRMTEVKVRKLSHSIYSFISLSDYITEDDTSLSAEETAINNLNILDLSSLGVSLTKREKEVISRRFGFTPSGHPETLLDISKNMNLSYETIRATYMEVIAKLQNAVEEKGLTINTISL